MPYTYKDSAVCLAYYSSSNHMITLLEVCDRLGHVCFQLCSNHHIQTFSLIEDLIKSLNALVLYSHVSPDTVQLTTDAKETLNYIELRNDKLQLDNWFIC